MVKHFLMCLSRLYVRHVCREARGSWIEISTLKLQHSLVVHVSQKCRGSVIKFLVTRLKNDMIYDENLRFCSKLRRLSLEKLVVELENGRFGINIENRVGLCMFQKVSRTLILIGKFSGSLCTSTHPLE